MCFSTEFLSMNLIHSIVAVILREFNFIDAHINPSLLLDISYSIIFNRIWRNFDIYYRNIQSLLNMTFPEKVVFPPAFILGVQSNIETWPQN